MPATPRMLSVAAKEARASELHDIGHTRGKLGARAEDVGCEDLPASRRPGYGAAQAKCRGTGLDFARTVCHRSVALLHVRRV